MLCKATLFTVALSLLASPNLVTGVSVPLAKRSSLTHEDGTFNHDKAIYQTVKTIKYVFFHTRP